MKREFLADLALIGCFGVFAMVAIFQIIDKLK